VARIRLTIRQLLAQIHQKPPKHAASVPLALEAKLLPARNQPSFNMCLDEVGCIFCLFAEQILEVIAPDRMGEIIDSVCCDDQYIISTADIDKDIGFDLCLISEKAIFALRGDGTDLTTFDHFKGL
jgi:hypothetical protein